MLTSGAALCTSWWHLLKWYPRDVTTPDRPWPVCPADRNARPPDTIFVLFPFVSLFSSCSKCLFDRVVFEVYCGWTYVIKTSHKSKCRENKVTWHIIPFMSCTYRSCYKWMQCSHHWHSAISCTPPPSPPIIITAILINLIPADLWL